jgi:hypothetical protein
MVLAKKNSSVHAYSASHRSPVARRAPRDGRYLRRHSARDSFHDRAGRVVGAVTSAVNRMTGNDRAMFWFMLLIVLGLIMMSFSLTVGLWGFDGGTARLLALIGTGVWTLDLAIFFFFWADPQPKHSRRR